MARDNSRAADGALRDFCTRLKRLQVMSGMPQAALASHAHLGKSQMSAILNGDIRRTPDWTIIQAVVRACLIHAEENGVILPPDVGDELAWKRRHADLEYDEADGNARHRSGHAGQPGGGGKILALKAEVAPDGPGYQDSLPGQFKVDLLYLLAKVDEAACRGSLPGYLPPGVDVPRLARTARLLGPARQSGYARPDLPVGRSYSPAVDANRKWTYRLPAEAADRADKPLETWENVAAAHDRLVVLADPGMGKSWLLRTQAHQLAQAAIAALSGSPEATSDVLVPILIRADVLSASPCHTLAEAITGYLITEEVLHSRSGPLMQEHIAAGGVVLLIDALDEFRAPLQRRARRHPANA